MQENELLRLIASKADVTIEFKDEKLLPGTGWIAGLPIDIQIVGKDVVLNSVGRFQGDSRSYSKGEFRGKGVFASLAPHIKSSLVENGFAPELYLLPLSPVWEERYRLVEVDRGVKGCYFKIIL